MLYVIELAWPSTWFRLLVESDLLIVINKVNSSSLGIS